jgi:stress response protein YsnF
MIPPRTEPPDVPFPGAHSQVTGRPLQTHAPTTSAPGAAGQLPLEASAASAERGWSMRLPVRAEHVAIVKETVVYERVAVRRRTINERARVDASVRREELRVDGV